MAQNPSKKTVEYLYTIANFCAYFDEEEIKKSSETVRIKDFKKYPKAA